MKTQETDLPGVLLFQPKIFGDNRGFFKEWYRADSFPENISLPLFVQDNFSRSQKNILRGLHYQLNRPQGKLVGVTRGAVFDVAVDVRRGSPSFGRWVGVVLDDREHRQIYIPPGFAHGFCVLSDEADVYYKCSDYYDPASERGVIWNDPALAISWPCQEPAVSGKDAVHPRLNEIAVEDLPCYEAAA